MHIIPLGYFNSFLPLKQFRFHCLLTPLQNVFAQSVLQTSLCNRCVLNLWWGNGSLKPEGWHLPGGVWGGLQVLVWDPGVRAPGTRCRIAPGAGLLPAPVPSLLGAVQSCGRTSPGLELPEERARIR